jgi:putative colanic acid biosynthesis glycosyltransferase
MKTLLQINTVVNSGSTGRIAEEIGQIAIIQGWKSFIAFGRHERASHSQLIKIGTEWDINIHGIQTRLFDRHGLGSKSATQTLIKQIVAIKPDVIHLHNIHGYYLNIEVLFKFLNNTHIPVVWTLHDCWPFTGHCVHFDFVGCNKWLSQCNRCPQTRTYPTSIFLDRSKQNFLLKKELFTGVQNLTLVPVSNWSAKLVKLSFLKDYPVQIINNGVNTEIFKPIPTQNRLNKYNLHSKFSLLGVANIWSSRKGLKDYIELSQKIDINCQIILVGVTLEQRKKLPENIIGIERTDNINELVELYSLSDIVLNLSYEETFGLTTVEGFACGTPGIVYNSTASPELITSDTGIIVEKGNINELHAAILKVKKNGKSHYSKACRERAIHLYNKSDRFQDYIDLYQNIVEKTSK